MLMRGLDGAGAGPALYTRVLGALRSFVAATVIRSERDLEADMCGYLEREHGCSVERQVVSGRGRNRYDLVCRHPGSPGETVCIEVKLEAASSDFEQFDRYIRQFPDGLVVACWSATGPVRRVVEEAARTSPVPVGLVEVGRQHALA